MPPKDALQAGPISSLVSSQSENVTTLSRAPLAGAFEVCPYSSNGVTL